MAQMYVQRFNKWICKHSLPEYKSWQDEVNAQKIDTNSGMFFSDRNNHYNWMIDEPSN